MSIEAGGSRAEDKAMTTFTDGVGQRWPHMEFGALRVVDANDPDAFGML
ncbi:hypothetical protein [[Micrococcus luteus] ATCC 49442]|nr:hypothetical protein [[Micrococcus luteus] ATCC 49442]